MKLCFSSKQDRSTVNDITSFRNPLSVIIPNSLTNAFSMGLNHIKACMSLVKKYENREYVDTSDGNKQRSLVPDVIGESRNITKRLSPVKEHKKRGHADKSHRNESTSLVPAVNGDSRNTITRMSSIEMKNNRGYAEKSYVNESICLVPRMSSIKAYNPKEYADKSDENESSSLVPALKTIKFSAMLIEEATGGEPMHKGRNVSIRKGKDSDTGKEVMVKKEGNAYDKCIHTEKKIYDCLEESGSYGFPQAIFIGEERGKVILVLEMLGHSLYDKKNHERSSWVPINFIAEISVSIISRLERLHALGYVHHNLQPTKIMFGQKKRGRHKLAHLIGFGHAVTFLKPDGSHIDSHAVKDARSSTWFSPVNFHKKLSQGRRDDLESLVYIISYMRHGSVPWSVGLDSDEAQLRKEEISGEELFRDMPHAFSIFHDVVRHLGFSDRPNYEGLRNLLRSVIMK